MSDDYSEEREQRRHEARMRRRFTLGNCDCGAYDCGKCYGAQAIREAFPNDEE